VEAFLALLQDVHDRALKSFATTCEGEERCGSRRSVVCIECYPPYQFFDVECLVHLKSAVGEMTAIGSKPGLWPWGEGNGSLSGQRPSDSHP